jgi:DNA-binding XRE family transcriptional regulator
VSVAGQWPPEPEDSTNFRLRQSFWPGRGGRPAPTCFLNVDGEQLPLLDMSAMDLLNASSPALLELGRQLRAARKRMGLTQAALATAARVGRETVIRAEQGEAADLILVSRIAEALGHRLTLARHWPRASEMRQRFAHVHEEDD